MMHLRRQPVQQVQSIKAKISKGKSVCKSVKHSTWEQEEENLIWDCTKEAVKILGGTTSPGEIRKYVIGKMTKKVRHFP
jgi:ribosomal protein L37AE/L43A